MTTRALKAVAEKKRKLVNGELRLPSSTFVQITPENHTIVGDHVDVSCCSVNESTEELQFTDLKVSNLKVEFETTARYDLETKSSKRSSEFKAGSIAPEILTAEIEEFFAAAEKKLHKRFKDKYNYDIVNDTPLEGRFEWVQMKP